MIKYFIYLIMCICFLLLKACSLISTTTIWQTPESWQKSTEHIHQWKHNYDDYLKINENIGNKNEGILPSPKFNTNTCFILDSIKIYPEDVTDKYSWFFGPPYLPVIPNLIEPFRYFFRNKKTDYYLMIVLKQSESDTIIKLKDLSFYSNDKEIVPKRIEEIEFVKKNIMDMYIVNSSWSGDSINYCSLYFDKTYLIIFNLNKNTLKSLEIMHKDKLFIKIKRKNKLYHEIIFAS